VKEPAGPAGPAPPAGFSLPRLSIDRDGGWLHDGVEVTHAGVLANLWENLRADAEGHYLQIGPYRVPVEVADAPFVVVRLEATGERLAATLNDGTSEVIDPATLSFRGSVPYCRVRSGAFEARLSRAAAHQLWRLAEHDETTGEARLVLGGRRYRLPAG
jgi:hypothetical protein